mgnify:CR=1 FL=1
MRDFGLVVIGAHFGVWLKDEIEKFKDQNINIHREMDSNTLSYVLQTFSPSSHSIS